MITKSAEEAMCRLLECERVLAREPAHLEEPAGRRAREDGEAHAAAVRIPRIVFAVIRPLDTHVPVPHTAHSSMSALSTGCIHV